MTTRFETFHVAPRQAGTPVIAADAKVARAYRQFVTGGNLHPEFERQESHQIYSRSLITPHHANLHDHIYSRAKQSAITRNPRHQSLNRYDTSESLGAMAPLRVSDEPAPAMAANSRKRSAEPNDDEPPTKRKREMASSVILAIGPPEESPCSVDLNTSEELARKALRRSLALALQKVGFDTATPDAMETFVSMTEICKIARPSLAPFKHI